LPPRRRLRAAKIRFPFGHVITVDGEHQFRFLERLPAPTATI
jgi:hypothetical protein